MQYEPDDTAGRETAPESDTTTPETGISFLAMNYLRMSMVADVFLMCL